MDSPISILPEELLAHIMGFLDLKQVCQVMRVSRGWESAARSVIRTRPVIILCHDLNEWGSMIHLIGGRDDDKDHSQNLVYGPFDASLINCMNQMIGLKVLLAGRHVKADAVRPLVLRNSQTLTVLSIDCSIPHGPGICYPQLRTVCCRSMTPAVIDSCPRLEKLSLTLQDEPVVFQYIPNKSLITELNCTIIHLHVDTGLMELVAGVRQLTGLTKLFLRIAADDWSDPGNGFNILFNNFTRLTDVRIRANNDEVNLDAGVSVLARNNPQLQVLKLRGFTLSDAALSALSKLTHMQKLILDTEDAVYSMDAIISLLRGPLRHVLCKFSIWHQPETDWTSVDAEIGLISEEIGKEIAVTKGGDWIKFQY
jgi:hypothetical protein